MCVLWSVPEVTQATCLNGIYTESEFSDEIQTKVLKFFLLAIQSHPGSFALRFLFLQTHATFYSFYTKLLYTAKQKGGEPDRKPHPLPYGFRNPYRKLKSDNSQDYAQKPHMNSASELAFVNLGPVRSPVYTHYNNVAKIGFGPCKMYPLLLYWIIEKRNSNLCYIMKTTYEVTHEHDVPSA